MKPLDWAGKEPSVFPPFPLFLARIIKWKELPHGENPLEQGVSL
jgi:hypothetical protein